MTTTETTTRTTTAAHSPEAPPVPRVVVGVDGSAPSVLALQWAAGYAGAIRATVEAVSAWHVPAEWGLAGLPLGWDPEENAGEVLQQAITAAFGDSVPPNLTRAIRQGPAAGVLLDAAQGAVLVVVGSRGHGGFVGTLLGSVSAALAEHAPCPVLVVHGDRPPLPLIS